MGLGKAWHLQLFWQIISISWCFLYLDNKFLYYLTVYELTLKSALWIHLWERKENLPLNVCAVRMCECSPLHMCAVFTFHVCAMRTCLPCSCVQTVIFLYSFPSYFGRQGLSWNPRALFCLKRLPSKTPGICLSLTPQHVGSGVCCHVQLLYGC